KPIELQINLNIKKVTIQRRILKKERMKYAYMGTMNNQSAFTFLEMMIVLSIIIITFPFITFLLEKIQDEDYNETVSVNQFFNYLQKDAFKAREVYHD